MTRRSPPVRVASRNSSGCVAGSAGGPGDYAEATVYADLDASTWLEGASTTSVLLWSDDRCGGDPERPIHLTLSIENQDGEVSTVIPEFGAEWRFPVVSTVIAG